MYKSVSGGLPWAAAGLGCPPARLCVRVCVCAPRPGCTSTSRRPRAAAGPGWPSTSGARRPPISAGCRPACVRRVECVCGVCVRGVCARPGCTHATCARRPSVPAGLRRRFGCSPALVGLGCPPARLCAARGACACGVRVCGVRVWGVCAWCDHDKISHTVQFIVMACAFLCRRPVRVHFKAVHRKWFDGLDFANNSTWAMFALWCALTDLLHCPLTSSVSSSLPRTSPALSA